MNIIAVYHMAAARSDGKVVASRLREVRRDEAIVSSIAHPVVLTPDEARRMAEAMRASHSYFFKDDAVGTVEIWCEPYEASYIAWTLKDGEEIREQIDCSESDGDGWSWEFV